MPLKLAGASSIYQSNQFALQVHCCTNMFQNIDLKIDEILALDL
jgi:hypothetical protein